MVDSLSNLDGVAKAQGSSTLEGTEGRLVLSGVVHTGWNLPHNTWYDVGSTWSSETCIFRNAFSAIV